MQPIVSVDDIELALGTENDSGKLIIWSGFCIASIYDNIQIF